MTDDVRVKFSKKLQAIRKERNLSQEKMALICGSDRTYLGRIERLERTPSLTVLQKIANGLNITLSELFKEIDL